MLYNRIDSKKIVFETKCLLTLLDLFILYYFFYLLFQVLYILPRITSTHATARVKLAKHRVEPHHHLTFGLAKRKKVTIWIKVGLNQKLFLKKNDADLFLFKTHFNVNKNTCIKFSTREKTLVLKNRLFFSWCKII